MTTPSWNPDPAPDFPGPGRRDVLVGAPLVLVLFAATRVAIPYEDAFITFRCARNLAEHGQYTYNLGEQNLAATSHLYTALCAVAFLTGPVPGSWLIALGNCVASVIGVYLFTALLLRKRGLRLLVWIGVALSPVGVELAYSGMETALFVLVLAAASWRTSGALSAPPRWTLPATFLVPLVRPDAIAHGGLVWLASGWRRRRIDVAGGLALLAGFGTLVALNLAVFGSVMTQSMIGKRVTYGGLDPTTFGPNLWNLFFENSVFSPVNAWFFNPIKPFLVVPMLALLVWGLVRRTQDRPAWSLMLALAILPTTAYALGGVLFVWYVVPGKIAALVGAGSAAALLLDAAMRSVPGRRAAVAAVLAVAVIGVCGQLVIGALNAGVEARTRIEAGRWIRENTPPEATLVLEPAGYLPYHAERRTWDEVGLASWQVIEARREYGESWLVPFLEQYEVDVVVQRDAFARDRVTFHDYPLTSDERAWFDTHYRLARTIRVDAADVYSNALLSRLAARAKDGRNRGLYIYLREPAP